MIAFRAYEAYSVSWAGLLGVRFPWSWTALWVIAECSSVFKLGFRVLGLGLRVP